MPASTSPHHRRRRRHGGVAARHTVRVQHQVLSYRHAVSAVLLVATSLSSLSSLSQHRGASPITPVEAKLYLLNATDYATQLGDDLAWARQNAPFFESSDADLTDTFYFRLRSYKLHITPTPAGFVITEFLPKVPWSQQYNAIPCAAGHHIMEGRWLRNYSWVDDYSRFWFQTPGINPRQYTFWAANAILARAHVTGDMSLPVSLLTALQDNVAGWRSDHHNSELGLYYQTDGADGGEDSIGGSGLRPTINSAMYGEMRAIASICAFVNDTACVQQWTANATELQQRALDILWNDDLQFFTTWKAGPTVSAHKADARHVSDIQGFVSAKDAAPMTPRQEDDSDTVCPPPYPSNASVTVRELLGLSTPFYFHMVPGSDSSGTDAARVDLTTGVAPDYMSTWNQLLDSKGGFGAKWGPRTAERRSPCYNYSVHHECLWNAPSWPYETARLLTALGNVLNDYPPQMIVDKGVFLDAMVQYARAHTQSTAINGTSPWIGEDLHPDNGYWLARAIMYAWDEPLRNRGDHYNHSTFLDLILSCLVGIRPRVDSTLVVNPLVPVGSGSAGKGGGGGGGGGDAAPAASLGLSYFAADGVLYHGHDLTILWDADGTRYGKGAGLQVWVDGTQVARSAGIQRLTAQL